MDARARFATIMTVSKDWASDYLTSAVTSPATAGRGSGRGADSNTSRELLRAAMYARRPSTSMKWLMRGICGTLRTPIAACSWNCDVWSRGDRVLQLCEN